MSNSIQDPLASDVVTVKPAVIQMHA